MALNGGIAYAGGMCGAVTGAAMAVGRLAEARLGDHHQAKRTARELIQRVMSQFEDRYGSTNCLDLTGVDFLDPEAHDRFIEEGVWRERCTDQIQFTIERLAVLASPEAWESALADVAGMPEDGSSELRGGREPSP